MENTPHLQKKGGFNVFILRVVDLLISIMYKMRPRRLWRRLKKVFDYFARVKLIFLENFDMSRVCQVTGKRPAVGNNVSHAKNRTRRRFLPNLQTHRFWVESENRFVKLRLTTKGMRIIDKKGIDSVLADIRANGVKV